MGDLAIKVQASVAAPAQQNKAGVAAVTSAIDLPVLDAPLAEHLDFALVLSDDEGKPQFTDRQTVTLSPRRASGETFTFQVLSRAQLKPGHYDVRISAHSQERSLTGSVFGDLVIPDFAKVPVAIAGIFVQVEPDVQSVPRTAFADLLPFVPSTRRQFSRSDSVLAYVRTYLGPRAPLVAPDATISIINQQDATVLDKSLVASTERLSTERLAEYRITLPVAELTSGEFLLKFSIVPAGAKQPEIRDMRFSVK
jgi:hypothetical protein